MEAFSPTNGLRPHRRGPTTARWRGFQDHSSFDAEDVAMLEEHEPELLDELREVVCEHD